MSEETFRIVVAAAVLIACFAFEVQAGIVLALYRVTRRMQDKTANFMATTEPLLAKVEPVLDKVGPVIDRIGLAADSLDKMGKETGLASNQVRSTVAAVGTQTMPEIQNLLAELEALSVSLRQLVQKIDRRPSSLLLGDNPIPEGPGETSPRQTKP